MATLSARLMALEQQRRATRHYSGLGYFYDTMEALDTVGGGNALIERLDMGTMTPADSEAVAIVPGGETNIRSLVASLDRFYP